MNKKILVVVALIFIAAFFLKGPLQSELGNSKHPSTSEVNALVWAGMCLVGIKLWEAHTNAG